MAYEGILFERKVIEKERGILRKIPQIQHPPTHVHRDREREMMYINYSISICQS